MDVLGRLQTSTGGGDDADKHGSVSDDASRCYSDSSSSFIGEQQMQSEFTGRTDVQQQTSTTTTNFQQFVADSQRGVSSIAVHFRLVISLRELFLSGVIFIGLP